MDNPAPSLSDIFTDDSNSDEESSTEDETSADGVSKVVESCSGLQVECNETKTCSLVLDLRNLNSSNDSQNEEEKYDKLSEVVEKPEDLPEDTNKIDQESTALLSSNEVSDTTELALEKRISALNSFMISLKEELKNEVCLWRKERDEFLLLQEKSDLLALEEATAAARAAAEAYAAESPLSENLDGLQLYNSCNFTTGEVLDVNPEQTLSELTILEYEKKLAKYQDALALAQAEKRYNMRRQIAANTYRQKLIEVERLCDEELEKIKQNASSLQPLKQMISQWYISDRCGGDGIEKSSSNSLDRTYKSISPFIYQQDYPRSNFSNASSIGNKIDAEVNMAPEIFVAKFKVDKTDFLSGTSNTQSGGNWENPLNNYSRHKSIGNEVNSSISLKWESSDYILQSTSLGNS